MEFITKSTFLSQYEISNVQENIEMAIYSLICLLIPMALSHPQFLVGTVVNAALLLAALNLKGYKLLPVIMLPSIGVLAAGAIFGNFTMLLVYMIPFIWAANALFVFLFKHIALNKKQNRFVSLGLCAGAKTIFLFVFAALFVSAGVLPTLFLASMGLFQLYTALAGGILALGIQYSKQALA